MTTAEVITFRSNRVREPYFDWLAWLSGREIDLPWCVVLTKMHREREVQAELAQAGWSTYLPMQTVWAKPSRLKRRVRRPLFPRYVFAACESEGDVAAPASIHGISSIRRSQSGRSLISPTVLGRLMFTEANHGLDLTYELPRPVFKTFIRGDKVKVMAGVLTGWDARIEKVLNAREVIATYVLNGRTGEATFRKSDLQAA